ncbi:AMP-binding protein [Leptolyngbya sp. 15MV]|nr:AMP-binding protein [Leptolyngbya sp. 15MV]
MSANALLHDGIAYWARRTPDMAAIRVDDDPPVTYAELARWSDGVAALLQARGVEPGDRVAIAAGNCPAWAAAAVGVLKAGATIVPFNDRLVAAELAWLADHAQPRLIIADEALAGRLASCAVPLLPLAQLDACRGGAGEGWRDVRVEAEEIAMIIFTSGSTSKPKGAMMSHANYAAKYHEMRLLDRRLGPGTRSLMPFGMHSSPGLPWGILFTTTLGGTLHCTRKYEAERLFDTLVRERIDFFIGVPMIYQQIADLPGFAQADFSALTFARVGGATPEDRTLAAWRAVGVAVRQLYGMTEVGGGSLIATEEEALAHPDSCGRGLAYTRVRIVRDDGSECDAAEPGHVLLRGPGMMSGYWRDPEASAVALADGWMHTGDIGSVDAAGYFRFHDRAKEMIKSGGFNVSPSEIERVLLDHPAILEAAVFGVPDDKFSEAPCACLHVTGDLSQESVAEYCAQRLAGFKRPRRIVIMDGPLPRLANEKIDRARLKALYRD